MVADPLTAVRPTEAVGFAAVDPAGAAAQVGRPEAKVRMKPSAPTANLLSTFDAEAYSKSPEV